MVYLLPFRILKRHVRVVYHCHTAFRLTRFNKAVLSKLINWTTDGIIAPSEYLKNELQKIGIGNVHAIYNGIDEPSKIQRSVLSGEREVFKVAILGAIGDQKGQDVFIQAIEALNVRGIPIEGHVAGYILDEAFAQLWLPRIQSNSAFLKYHDTLSHEESLRLIDNCDLVVSASKYRETLPTVLLEAMSLSKPVIGTTVGGIPEIITHEANGLLVTPDNPDMLASAIETILSRNLARDFGTKGLAIFKEKFSKKKYLEKMTSFLNEN
jgi:glycosyltransferase involved in cell wall biosynthesis